MTYTSRYKTFYFEKYHFDHVSGVASFHYSFDHDRKFEERLQFSVGVSDYDKQVFERTLQLAFIIAGISYYKTFPTPTLEYLPGNLNAEQAAFFDIVYKNGLSQYIYENQLLPSDIGTFVVSSDTAAEPIPYEQDGILALQSGGKDSLLLATIMTADGKQFETLYITSSGDYPAILDDVGSNPPRLIRRTIDSYALRDAAAGGAMDGHVPATFITLAYALVDAVLHNESTVLAAIGCEGEEPHAMIGDFVITHQWSKTWAAEQLFAQYVATQVSADIKVGSPLRELSELKIAEQFVEKCWNKYGHSFSSCNRANYQQGHLASTLAWCGECPKCANSFLLFAPFVEPSDLENVFGHNLFGDIRLTEVFKGLLGIDDAFKPFECVGEIDELRYAYRLSVKKNAEAYQLPFYVPDSSYDYNEVTPAQPWAAKMLQ